MYVGTVHKNKREIPYEILDKKNISSGQSAFVFTTDMTLVTFESNLSKTQKKNKFVLCPKGGVDTFDHMCSFQVCSRMTKRWLPTVFHCILNAAVVNVYVL